MEFIKFDSKVILLVVDLISMQFTPLCTCSDMEIVLFVSVIDQNEAQNGGDIYAFLLTITSTSSPIQQTTVEVECIYNKIRRYTF